MSLDRVIVSFPGVQNSSNYTQNNGNANSILIMLKQIVLKPIVKKAYTLSLINKVSAYWLINCTKRKLSGELALKILALL